MATPGSGEPEGAGHEGDAQKDDPDRIARAPVDPSNVQHETASSGPKSKRPTPSRYRQKDRKSDDPDRSAPAQSSDPPDKAQSATESTPEVIFTSASRMTTNSSGTIDSRLRYHPMPGVPGRNAHSG